MAVVKKNVRAGMHLFRENDRSRELYILQSGKLKVYRTAGGKEIELAVVESGSVVGEMALIDGKPRSASVKALEDSTVIIIDAETFHRKIKGVPPWFMSIIRMTCQKIRMSNRRIRNSFKEHEGANVVIALLLYFQRFDVENRGISCKIVQRHLINLLGVNFNTLIQVLDFLQEKEFIDIRNDCIHIIDKIRLNEYCEYLRLLMRNRLDVMKPPARKFESIASILVDKYPQILKDDAGSTSVEGGLFNDIMKASGIEENAVDLIGELSAASLCSIIRQKKENTDTQLLSDMVIKLIHIGWKRIYLFCKFNNMLPCKRL